MRRPPRRPPRLLGGAGGDHLVDPRVDPAPELLAVDGQADEQGRATKPRGPELLASPRRLDAGALKLERPRDPLAVSRVDRRGDVRVELTVERLRATLGDLALDLLAHIGRNRRAQVEVGERGAQVEAGPADHDRPAALRQELVDLRVRKGREPPGAELAAHLDEADQPVLEPRALLGGRGPAQRLESPVDLDRVARDGDRVLAAFAQEIGGAIATAVFPIPVGPKIARI